MFGSLRLYKKNSSTDGKLLLPTSEAGDYYSQLLGCSVKYPRYFGLSVATPKKADMVRALLLGSCLPIFCGLTGQPNVPQITMHSFCCSITALCVNLQLYCTEFGHRTRINRESFRIARACWWCVGVVEAVVITTVICCLYLCEWSTIGYWIH